MPNAEPQPPQGRKPLSGTKTAILVLLAVGIMVGWSSVPHKSPWWAVFLRGRHTLLDPGRLLNGLAPAQVAGLDHAFAARGPQTNHDRRD
jgi:hypothetical protein